MNECQFIKEDLIKPVNRVNVFDGSRNIVIEHDPQDCINETLTDYMREQPPTCMYNIAIIGTSSNIDAKYNVKIYNKDNHVTNLHESQPFEDDVEYEETNYYKVTISDSTINSVTFQLLSIHGNAKMYVSRNNTILSSNTCEKQSFSYSNEVDTVEYNKSNENDKNQQGTLVGTYYIAVFGQMASSYHIYYETQRMYINPLQQQTISRLPTILRQNHPVRGLINSPNDYRLYSFAVSNVSPDEKIFIKITPQKGMFRFYVKYHGVASPEDYDFIGGANTHWYLEFEPSKNITYANGDFSIYVEPIMVNNYIHNKLDISFLVNYFIGTIEDTMLNNQPIYGYTTLDRPNYYTFKYDQSVTHIRVELTKLSGDVQTIISLNQAYELPTIDSVDPEKVMGLDSDIESTYAIAVASYHSKDEKIIKKIEPTVPKEDKLDANEWVYYRFTTNNRERISATLIPSFGSATIYVSMITDLTLEQSDWELPTETKHLSQSKDSIGGDRVVLFSNDLEECGDSCILIFGVKSNSKTKFSFSVNDLLVTLREKHVFTDSFGKVENFKLYDYFRPCKICNTLIAVNPISDEMYTIDVYYTDNSTELSYMNQSTPVAFTTSGRGYQELKIKSKDLTDKGFSDTSGYFVIKISSNSTMNYTVSASSSQKYITAIQAGQNFNFEINDSTEYKVYSYMHSSEDSFVVSTHFKWGYGEIYANVIPISEKGDIYKHVPSRENHTWSSFTDDDPFSLEISKSNEHFCSPCRYIFTVTSPVPSKGHIKVNELENVKVTNKIHTLKLGESERLIMYETKFLYYKFIIDSNSSVLINLNVLAGNMEYKLSNYKIDDKDFDLHVNENTHDGLIHHGKHNEGMFAFETINKNFKVGETFYMIIRSNVSPSKGVLTIGYEGAYVGISDDTPQKVIMDNKHHVFYYSLNSFMKHSNIRIDTLPQNKFETYKVYSKIVPINETLYQDDNSTKATWHTNYNDVVRNPDFIIEYDGQRSDALSVAFDVDIETQKDRKILYIVVVSTSAEASLSTMDLYVTSSSYQHLELGVERWGNVENKNEVMQLYSISVPPTQNYTYLVEIIPCYGEVQMTISKNMSELLNGIYEFKGTTLSSGKIYSIIENNSQKTNQYIVSVQSTNNVTEGETYYEWSRFKVLFRKYTKTEATHEYYEKYFVPENGKLEWSYISDSILQVSWERVVDYTGTKEISHERVFYESKIDTASWTGFESSCWNELLDLEGDIRYINFNGHNNYIQIDLNKVKSESNKLFISVRAAIEEVTPEANFYPTYYRIPYQSLEISVNQNTGSKTSKTLIVVGVVVILILVACIIFYFMKYKKTKKKLDEEVNMVQGTQIQGTSSDSSAMEIKKYNKFRNETDMEKSDMHI